MFKFKIKIQNEHSLKLRENNEHKLSIKAMMATIIIYVGGVIRYSSKTAINKAVILARALLTNSYKSSTTMLGKMFVRLVGIGSLYKSSLKVIERFLIKAIPSSLRMSHGTSILGKILARFTAKDSKYSIDTLISKAVILARAFLINSYRGTTSAIGKVFIRLRGENTSYNSSSSASEKFLVKLSPLPLREIPLNEYSDTLLKKLHSSLKHISYITNDIYQSLVVSLSEKILVALKIKELKYLADTQNTSSKILSKMTSVTDFYSRTTGNIKAWIRGRGALLFRSNTSASTKASVKSSFSSTIYKIVSTIKDILSVKTQAQNSSSFSTKMTKEGLGVNVVGQAIKYVCSTASSSVNKVLTRLRGDNNSYSSKTEVSESKMYDYYTIKLNAYEGKKLNEVPSSLLRFCYIVDKNWASVKKVYKLWSNVKERTSSWRDLK